MTGLPDLTDVAPSTSVSRETEALDRRRIRRPLVRQDNGRFARTSGSWTDEQIAVLGKLIAANCTAPDIAGHFSTTPAAIRMLASRYKLRWPCLPRPAVETVLATLDVPTVILLSERAQYQGKVELHEIDGNYARIRDLTFANGVATQGRWHTVFLARISFQIGQDRAALIEAAKARAAASKERRASLHQQPNEETNG